MALFGEAPSLASKLAPARRNTKTRKLVAGVPLQLAHAGSSTALKSDSFALAMGNLGAYPPFLAAWAPFLLFLLIGEAVLLRTEE